jgi:hypothetical protein
MLPLTSAMPHRGSRFGVALLIAVLAAATPFAAALSRQQADAFQRKLDVINRQGDVLVRQGVPRTATPVRRTPFSEAELNSWFAYRAQPLLPAGVANPQMTIVGNGKVMGTVIVDIGAMSKQKSSGGTFDPFSYLGGRVPVAVSGILHTGDGRGRFELQSADISGVPVPKTILQELVSYYSRSAGHPSGVRLDDPFELPAGIQKIEVGQAQAVVVQ